MNQDLATQMKYTIGVTHPSIRDGEFNFPRGLAFDRRRGQLYVVDNWNHDIQVFLSEDGSFMSKFGYGLVDGPWGVAIDDDHDRMLVADSTANRIQVWSLNDRSFVTSIVEGSRDLAFNCPRGIAIDEYHQRIIIADTNNDRLVFLSSIDLSFLFALGKQGSQPGEFHYPSGVAIDHDRHRIIVSDTFNHRVQVLSLIDGSFLFQFGSPGNRPGQFYRPQGVCVDNQGRIIVVDTFNCRLQAFTHEGHPITSLKCTEGLPSEVAFDSHRGLIAFSAGNRVHVIGANQWLPDTWFMWRVERHCDTPPSMKRVIETVTMIRSLHHESTLSLLPNELLFEIFAMLNPSTWKPTPRCTSPSRQSQPDERTCTLL